MRVVFEIFPCFCYRRTRNQILQLLLHGNYVVAVFQLDLVNIVRSLNKINSQNIVLQLYQSRSPSLRSLGRKRRLWDNPLPEARNPG